MVDVARPKSVIRNKRIKKVVYAVLVLVAASAVTLGLSRMAPAAPSVDGATLWPDTVKRGEMLRQVRGLGTLVPEEVRFIPATFDSIIEQRKARAGDTVTANSIILVMSNPDVQQRATDAELQLKGAEADLANLGATLQSQILNQQVQQAGVESDYNRAKLDFEANRELAKDGLIADVILKKSQVTTQELAAKNEMEKKKVEVNSRSADAQIAAQQARVDQYRAAFELRKKQVDELTVRAMVAGVVQQVPVEPGQRVAPGTILAKVAQPGRLRAELQIAETQVKDVAIGQIASIDTRNGIIPGQVIRIDPASVNGTVKVDVQLNGEYPKGVRPDLSVDGTIEVERLPDVLYVGRPAYGQADTTVSMFKWLANGDATRVQVKLGRTSVNTIEIKDGLQIGDRVILSDMSAWDAYDRLRIN
ncbi:MAG TPA: HlyD family efflux transporter periplasmic adaptor subunit [Terriglobia bacterium]|nr:HlyD family efflux transporter periplasmic adaptor subunit [Terriglobia bacterium]